MGLAQALVEFPFKAAARQQRYQAVADAGRANAAELERAALVDEANAVDALRRGGLAGGRRRMEGSLLRQRQAVGYTASGVDASVGTPAAVGAATSLMAEVDAQTAEYNAVREAMGFKEAARGFRFKAEQERKAIERAGIERDLGIVSDFVGLGGAAASFWGGGK